MKFYEHYTTELENFVVVLYDDVQNIFGNPKRFYITWDDATYFFDPVQWRMDWFAEYDKPEFDAARLKISLLY
ncbi:MAG: hypothetical protein GY756_19690 [bacterium]|nr:hypothetical protein [bacterium]